MGIGSALLAWSSNKFRVTLQTQSNSLAAVRPALLLLAFAIAFTGAGLLQYLRSGSAGDGLARAKMSRNFLGSATFMIDGTYKGVILLPEKVPHAVLVPPRPSQRNPFAQKRSSPLNVPFVGVYWMYRWPNKQPPPDSLTARGSPLSSNFYVTDRRALQMEARQNFGTLIDLNCCSRIQLVVRSADGPTTVDLILTNTTLPDRPSQSLGQVKIDSTLHQRRGADSSAVPMVLNFDVPRRSEIREFDEATIVFNRAYATASAKVTIDRFVFVPKGL